MGGFQQPRLRRDRLAIVAAGKALRTLGRAGFIGRTARCTPYGQSIRQVQNSWQAQDLTVILAAVGDTLLTIRFKF